MRPSGPYPILILRGPSGSGKTTAARLLRTLIDPTQTPLETLPATPTQWEAAASRHRILACDDVDRIPSAAVSTLAKIADETTPVILVLSPQFTGAIPEQIAKRSLIVDLTPAQNVRTLFSLRREFDTLHPHVLGALCTAVSKALRGFEVTAEMTYPRLADAAAWTCAAAPALDRTDADIRAAVAKIPEPSADIPVTPRTKHKTAARSAPSRSAPPPPALPDSAEAHDPSRGLHP
jgi:energy-coupling factor transporter ATP-binding protein EcfA2